MKVLTRVLAVLAVVAVAVPALACQDMQQTTAEKAQVQQPVAKSDKAPKQEQAKRSVKQTTVAKAQTAKSTVN